MKPAAAGHGHYRVTPAAAGAGSCPGTELRTQTARGPDDT